MVGQNSNKDKLRKKLELLKKTSEIDAILQKGDIEEQALTTGAGDSRPEDESHIIDLLDNPSVPDQIIIKPSAKKETKIALGHHIVKKSASLHSNFSKKNKKNVKKNLLHTKKIQNKKVIKHVKSNKNKRKK
jgi:hypothetical protein